MKGSNTHTNIIRERLTILMVILFCVLVSSSEYIIVNDAAGTVTSEQQDGQQNSKDENSTFLHTAVDAVVPFVVIVANHAFHLIYEIVGFEGVALPADTNTSKLTNHFFEILFEQIISVNAP